MQNRSTILIIDDEKQTLDLLVSHFRRRNFEPISTVNPKTVEQTLQNFHVHLIIVDLRMEGRSGYEILESLQKQGNKIPVLIMTAYLEDEKDKLAKLGVTENNIIKKPFGDFSQAEAVIGKVLNKAILLEEVDSEYEDRIYRHNKTKLLLVDSDTELTEMIKESFEARRYQVTTLEDGETAFQYIRSNECHVAIIAMNIPKLKGHFLIQKALKIRPTLQIIPYSGAIARDMQDLLVSVGFNPEKFLPKPFVYENLVERVKVCAAEAGTLEV